MKTEEGQRELVMIANDKKRAERKKAILEDPEQKMKELEEVTESRAGTTATVILITADKVICANAGDSRSIVGRNWTTYSHEDPTDKAGESEALSIDHKPEDKVEQTRIEKAGGFVE
jgi:protein phosphatase 2C family protein 2/3